MLTRRGLTDLVEQIDRLAAPADEVSRGHLGLCEDRGEATSLCPRVNGPDEAQVEFSGGRHAESGLDFGQLSGEIGEGDRSLAHAPSGEPRAVLALASLVDHRTRHRGQLRGAKALPHPLGDRLRHQEIGIGVDPRKQVSPVRDLRRLGCTGEIAGLEEQVADPVELTRDARRTRVHASLQ